MKKFLTGCALFFVIAASCAVSFASEIPYKIKCDYANNAVEVSGDLDSECNYVTLQILKDGYTFSEYDISGEQAQIMWRGQAEVTDGSYLFEVGYPADTESKSYSARLVTDKKYEKTIITSLMLVNETDYINAVNEMNRLASENDYSAFESFVKTDGYKAGFDLSLLNKLSGEESLTAYFAYVKENPLSVSEAELNAKTFNTFVLMEGLSQGKIGNINDYIENTVITDLAIYEDYKTYASTKSEQEYITSKMSRKNADSIEEFENNLKQAILLEEIYNASGYGDVRDILKLYGNIAGITGTAPDAVYKKMTGKDYTDVSALYEHYNELCNTVSTGGSGGGGSGGGSASGNDTKVRIESDGSSSDEGKISKKNVLFNDIDGVDWAVEAILALADKGIINGKAENYFYPNDDITREEFAKIMVIAMGYGNEKANGSYFSDVNADDWFFEYVNIAYEKNILKGTGNGLFGTGMLITRQDMCVMICNALASAGKAPDAAELPFSDASAVAGYARNSVSALYGAGIVNGVSETEIYPTGNASRAQAAKMVYGMLNLL